MSGFLTLLSLVDVPGQIAEWWHVFAWLGGEVGRWSVTAAFGVIWLVTTVWIRATTREHPRAAASAVTPTAPQPAGTSRPDQDEDPAFTKLRLSVNQANVNRRARMEEEFEEERQLIRRAYRFIGLLEEPDALQHPSTSVTLPRDVRRFAREARGFIRTALMSYPRDELFDEVLEDAMLEGDHRIDLIRVVTSYRDILERRSASRELARAKRIASRDP